MAYQVKILTTTLRDDAALRDKLNQVLLDYSIPLEAVKIHSFGGSDGYGYLLIFDDGL